MSMWRSFNKSRKLASRCGQHACEVRLPQAWSSFCNPVTVIDGALFASNMPIGHFWRGEHRRHNVPAVRRKDRLLGPSS